MKKQLASAVLAIAFAFNLAPLTTTVEAATGHSGNWYEFGNVRTRDNTHIAELKGVPVDGIVNLNRIEVPGQTIVGWYLDASFTTPVEDEYFLPTGFVTVTESIMENGLYPKYASDVAGSTGSTGTTGSTGSTGSTSGPTTVPSTGVAVLGQLF